MYVCNTGRELTFETRVAIIMATVITVVPLIFPSRADLEPCSTKV